MSPLVFDEVRHFYSLDGKPIPAVSSILKSSALSDFSGIPLDVMERARDFGKAVHKACELHDLNTLDPATLDSAIALSLEAWAKFKADVGAEVEEIEMPVYSKKLWVAGTLDRVVLIGGKRILVDIKSSAAVYPAMKIQLAGYKILYEEMSGVKIHGRMIVQVARNGSYITTSCDDESDESVFLSCVQIHKFKKREGKYYDKRNNNS